MKSSLEEYEANQAALMTATVIENPFIPITPTEPQYLFLATPADEAMYGGAAGGGKSAALLAAAAQYAEFPGYAALLLRRTYADLKLPGALISRSKEWWSGGEAHWNEQLHQWVFPGGATITFGYLEHEDDKYRYQSSEFQFIGFDELSQFTESQYRYMNSRLRRLTDFNVPVRMRAASNPGGTGHDWVKRRFITEGDGTRLFIPAKLEDNPYLDREEYEASLENLDPVTRAQLRHGNWDVRPEGNLFKREWFKVVDDAPPCKRWVRFWDLAATEEGEGQDPDWTAGCKMGEGEDGMFYVADVQHFRARPSAVERIIHEAARADGYDCAVRMEQEPGASGKSLVSHYAREVLKGFDFRGVASGRDKVSRANPLSAASERRDVKLVCGSWVTRFLDELCAFPEVAHDDQVDAASGAFHDLTADPDPWNGRDLAAVFAGPRDRMRRRR